MPHAEPPTIPAPATEDGALHVTLQCAQPLSGARLVAGVVHLVPSEYRAAAEQGKQPGLSAGYEVRWRACAISDMLQLCLRLSRASPFCDHDNLLSTAVPQCNGPTSWPNHRPHMQARLVRAALEGALQHLKAQCPAVVSSRRERSLGRALPLLSKALAGGRGCGGV